MNGFWWKIRWCWGGFFQNDRKWWKLIHTITTSSNIPDTSILWVRRERCHRWWCGFWTFHSTSDFVFPSVIWERKRRNVCTVILQKKELKKVNWKRKIVVTKRMNLISNVELNMICGLSMTHSHTSKITKWAHILVIPLVGSPKPRTKSGAFWWFWLQPKRWGYIFWFFDILFSMAISPHNHKLKSESGGIIP